MLPGLPVGKMLCHLADDLVFCASKSQVQKAKTPIATIAWPRGCIGIEVHEGFLETGIVGLIIEHMHPDNGWIRECVWYDRS